MEFERPAPNSVSLTGKTNNRIQHAARLQGAAEQLRRTGRITLCVVSYVIFALETVRMDGLIRRRADVIL